METLVPFIIQLISGAIGGLIAGIIFRKISLGPVGNILAGIVGGGIGGQMAGMAAIIGLDGYIADVLTGGFGGGGLMVVIGLAKMLMGGNSLHPHESE
jgi:hypothetical protein